MLSWFRKAPKTVSYCSKHGKGVEFAVVIRGLGKLDGRYCGRCKAEFIAKNFKRLKEVPK